MVIAKFMMVMKPMMMMRIEDIVSMTCETRNAIIIHHPEHELSPPMLVHCHDDDDDDVSHIIIIFSVIIIITQTLIFRCPSISRSHLESKRVRLESLPCG